jgi:pilus assembly protein FimV
LDKKKRWFSWQSKKGFSREIQELLQKIEVKPRDARLHQRLAELYLEKGHHDRAVSAFIKAAECHSEAGFHLRAIALYRRILRMNDDSTEIRQRLAELYLLNGLLGDALIQYRRIFQRFRQQGQKNRILKTLQRMAQTASDNLEVRIKTIEMMKSEGFPSRAFEEFVRLYLEKRKELSQPILAHWEEQIKALHGLLKVKLEKKGDQRALKDLDQRLELLRSPQAEGAAAGEGEDGGAEEDVVELRDEEEILVDSAEMQADTEASVPQLLREAEIYAAQGLFDEAESLYREILDLDPQHSEASKGVESVRRQRRQMIVPQDPSGVFQKLNLLEERETAGKDEDESAKQSTYAKGQEDARVHLELALAYKELGLIDECIDELLVAAEDPALEFTSYRELSSCHAKKGNLEQAIELLQKAIETTEASPVEILEARYQLAQLLEQQGQKKEALQMYQEIEESDQSYRDVQERVKSLSQ